MAEKLYYMRTGSRINGPFPLSQLQRLKEKGLIGADSLVSENRIAWQTLEEIIAPEPENGKVDEPDPISLVIPEDPPIPPESEVAAAVQPHTPVEAENPLEPVEETSSPAEELEQQEQPSFQIIPDPVCATIGLCWCARKQIENLHRLQQRSEEEGTTKQDRNILYTYGTTFSLIFFLFLSVFLSTYLMTPENCGALLVSAGALLVGGMLLLLLENLFLAMIARLEKIMAPFLLAMQFVCIALAAFAVGIPLFGLYLAGIEHCPVWLVYGSFCVSGFALLYSLINLAWGYAYTCRTVFGFGKVAVLVLTVLFTLQWLAVFPVGFLIYGFIQKNNLFS